MLQQKQSELDEARTEVNNLRSRANEAEKAMFDIVVQDDTVQSYESFLNYNPSSPDFRAKASQRVFELTVKADLIEGYVYFLENHPSHQEAPSIGKRLYKVAYAVAEKKNTISNYESFLREFEAVPEPLRGRALEKMLSLQEEAVRRELRLRGSMEGRDREHDIDRIGMRLYTEAVEAKKKGDRITFLRSGYALDSRDPNI